MNLIITKKNCSEYLQKWSNSFEMFIVSLKKFCKISPEFTLKPQMKIFKDGLFYESNYSYGKFIVRLKFVFFYFDGEKLRDYGILIFDLKSFDIKTATQSNINKMCGISPPWYDRKGKLSDETRKLIEMYIQNKSLLRA